MANNKPIKILQANLAHSRQPTLLLSDFIAQHQVDFVITSEPYTRCNLLPHLPHTHSKFASLVNPRPGLVTPNTAYDIFLVHANDLCVIFATCAATSVSFAVVAVYTPSHEPLEPIFDELQLRRTQLTIPFVVMAGDFNAKHIF